jgi:hypothetical protein
MILLSDMEGWPVAELAQIYNKPKGTVKARLSRARRKMRRAIDKNIPLTKIIKIPGEANHGLPRCKTAIE